MTLPHMPELCLSLCSQTAGHCKFLLTEEYWMTLPRAAAICISCTPSCSLVVIFLSHSLPLHLFLFFYFSLSRSFFYTLISHFHVTPTSYLFNNLHFILLSFSLPCTFPSLSHHSPVLVLPLSILSAYFSFSAFPSSPSLLGRMLQSV